jgi:hypothetical protein
MSNLGAVCLFLVFASLSAVVSAQDLELRWRPSTSSGAAGYYAYIAPSKAGALVATRIDVGRPAPDAAGISRFRLTGVDKTAPLLAIEMTTYDSLRRESTRSNRVQVAGDGETVGSPSWSTGFTGLNAGASPLGFVHWGGVFGARLGSNGSVVFGSPEPSLGGLSVARYVGSGVWWKPYELEGRIKVVTGSLATGVGVRVEANDLSSAFLLGGDAAGEFALDQVGKAELECDGSPSTGVRVVRNRWFRFRLRHTAPGGVARLRAKVWDWAALEPSQWQADCSTVTTPPSDGRGFAFYQAGVGVAHWDDVLVRPMTGLVAPIP